LELPDQLVDVVLSCADRSERHHLGAALLRRVGDGNGLLVNIETDVQGLAWLTSTFVLCREHRAALALPG
jgi:hypothetical protein